MTQRYVIMGDDGGVLVVLMELEDAKAQADSLVEAKGVTQRVLEQGGTVVYTASR